MLPSLSVIRADTSAILFVIATEGTAGVDQFVIRWEEAQHRAALDDGRHTYFIGRDGPDPIGFAIVRDWASPERVAAVKRIAVGRPGLGHGRALLTGVVDAVFKQTNAWHVWLGVFPDNAAARRAHEACRVGKGA